MLASGSLRPPRCNAGLNHWGPVDETKTLPIERINELFGSMASYYKPPTEEVRAVRARAWHVQIQLGCRHVPPASANSLYGHAVARAKALASQKARPLSKKMMTAGTCCSCQA